MMIIRRYSSCKAFCLGFCTTFFSAFDIPVFWPILVAYWLVLFFLTMKRQIKHMIKHRYLPFSTGKKVRRRACVPTTPHACNYHHCFENVKVFNVILTRSAITEMQWMESHVSG